MARPMPLVSPCAPWLCSGTSTPTELARAATTRRGALRSTTSMASSITPTGSTIYSSPPPWEGENYEPRNPMESEALKGLHLSPSAHLCRLHDTRLEPTHNRMGVVPVDGMPVHRVAGDRTSRCCHCCHLLCLL